MQDLAQKLRCGNCNEEKSYEEMVHPLLCKKCEGKEKAKNIIKAIVPPRYQKMDCEEDVLSIYRGKSLFISGNPGVGKTVLAVSLLKDAIRRDGKGQYVSYPDLIMRLQDTYKKDSDSAYDIVKKISHEKGLLVIDDLGAEKLTDYVRQITYFLFNEREQWDLPLIVTSNYSLSKISEQIDDRISSRIAGMCQILELDGTDRRLQKKGEM